MNPGAKKDFIRINISDSGQSSLVEKPSFNPSSAGTNQGQECLLINFQGIRPETTGAKPFQFDREQKPEPAESPGIPIVEGVGNIA